MSFANNFATVRHESQIEYEEKRSIFIRAHPFFFGSIIIANKGGNCKSVRGIS